MNKQYSINILAELNAYVESGEAPKEIVGDVETLVKKLASITFGFETAPVSAPKPKSPSKDELTKEEKEKVAKDVKEAVKADREEARKTKSEEPKVDDPIVEEVIEKPKQAERRPLADLIKELPEGDSLLVGAPHSYLASMPPKLALKFLAGTKISSVVTADAIAKASKTGVNKDFANVLLKAHTLSVTKVAEADDISGDPKVEAFVTKNADHIPFGKELFELMSRGGVDKSTVGAFKKLIEIHSK